MSRAMSHRIDVQGARAMAQEPGTAMSDSAAVLDTVHAIEDGNLAPSRSVCDNPLCRNEYEATCLPWGVQRYCSPRCRQQASLIRRAAKLLTMLSDEETMTVLRGFQG